MRKLLEEIKEEQLEHERAMEDMVMRSAEKSKRMSAALESLFGWTEPEDQLPETAFATILSPLETLDVKKVVSKGDNTVNPAEDDQLPENLESKMDTSVDHFEAYDQRTKDAPEETAFMTTLSPLETLDVKKVVSKGNNVVMPEDTFPEPVRMSMMPTMAEKGHEGGKMTMTIDQRFSFLHASFPEIDQETLFILLQENLYVIDTTLAVLFQMGKNDIKPAKTCSALIPASNLSGHITTHTSSVSATVPGKGSSRHGAGSVNATMSVQDGVLRGSSRDAGRHQSAHSATAMSLLEAVLVKGVASGEPETARDFVVAAVFADGYPRGSVGAMKHMHDRWKWRWKLPVLPN
jgi:hypothetical protein